MLLAFTVGVILLSNEGLSLVGESALIFMGDILLFIGDFLDGEFILNLLLFSNWIN